MYISLKDYLKKRVDAQNEKAKFISFDQTDFYSGIVSVDSIIPL